MPGDLAGIPGQFTVQQFTSGSGTYVPTSPLVTWIKVRMIGGGSGGGGSAAGNTTFGGWVALGGGASTGPSGSGGGAGATGGGSAGATLGTPGTDGVGTRIDRVPGGDGLQGSNNQSASTVSISMRGGIGSYGSQPAPGSGGFGALALVPTVGGGGSGAAGETVWFMMTAAQIGAGIPWSIGAASQGTAGSPNLTAGGAGADGRITIEEYYTPAG